MADIKANNFLENTTPLGSRNIHPTNEGDGEWERLTIDEFLSNFGIPKGTDFNIGDWNMDTSDSVSVTGISNWENVRGMSAVIFTDSATTGVSPVLLHQVDSSSVAQGGYQNEFGSVVLYRKTGGVFDSTSYNSTPYNRGILTVYHDGPLS